MWPLAREREHQQEVRTTARLVEAVEVDSRELAVVTANWARRQRQYTEEREALFTPLETLEHVAQELEKLAERGGLIRRLRSNSSRTGTNLAVASLDAEMERGRLPEPDCRRLREIGFG